MLQKPASNIAEEHKITLIIYESKNASFISNIENARKKRFPASKKKKENKNPTDRKKRFPASQERKKKKIPAGTEKREKKQKKTTCAFS